MTESVSFRALTPADAPAVTDLSRDAGWNQPEQEIAGIIRRSRNHILGAFTRSGAENDSLAGLAAAYVYSDAGIAFVNEVIVRQKQRRQGIATNILKQLIPAVQAQTPCIRLYATELGRPIYEKLGFIPYGTLKLCQLEITTQTLPADITHATENDLQDMTVLDTELFGARRESVLRELLLENPRDAWCLRKQGRLQAFALKGPMSWLVQARHLTALTAVVQHGNVCRPAPCPVLIWNDDAQKLAGASRVLLELTAMQLGNAVPFPVKHHSGCLPDIG